jgi:hypothetical protein
MDCYRLKAQPNKRPLDEESRKAKRSWVKNMSDMPQGRCSAATVVVGGTILQSILEKKGFALYKITCMSIGRYTRVNSMIKGFIKQDLLVSVRGNEHPWAPTWTRCAIGAKQPKKSEIRSLLPMPPNSLTRFWKLNTVVYDESCEGVCYWPNWCLPNQTLIIVTILIDTHSITTFYTDFSNI